MNDKEAAIDQRNMLVIKSLREVLMDREDHTFEANIEMPMPQLARIS